MLLNHFAVHLKLTQYCKSTIFPFLKKIFLSKNTFSKAKR